MTFRATNPVVITCDQCGQQKQLKTVPRRPKDGAFCSRKCSGTWHRAHDEDTVWRLMELTRLLWNSRPKGFSFAPAACPPKPEWRRELNAMGKWIREVA